VVEITTRSAEVFVRVVQALCANSLETNVREFPIRNPDGTQIATLVLHDLPKRPRDMPRAYRPKQKLSKRQRAAAKHKKVTT